MVLLPSGGSRVDLALAGTCKQIYSCFIVEVNRWHRSPGRYCRVTAGVMADFSLLAGVVARAWERDMLEWLYRYISHSVVLEKRLSLRRGENGQPDTAQFYLRDADSI